MQVRDDWFIATMTLGGYRLLNILKSNWQDFLTAWIWVYDRGVKIQGFSSMKVWIWSLQHWIATKMTWENWGLSRFWKEDQEFRFGYVKFEKTLRHLTGVVKLERRIWSSGARPGDRSLRTSEYIEFKIPRILITKMIVNLKYFEIFKVLLWLWVQVWKKSSRAV